MSKELAAFNRAWEDCSKLDLDYVSKHNLMDDLREIKQALQQAQKQEKLLELYKELSNFYVQLYTMELSELSLNSNYYEIELIKLKSKIKELENENM